MRTSFLFLMVFGFSCLTLANSNRDRFDVEDETLDLEWVDSELRSILRNCDQSHPEDMNRCLVRGIRYVRENINKANHVPVCVGADVYGMYAKGGGCNIYGCWFAGGGCNMHGCYTAGGDCNMHGCYAQGGQCNIHGCTKELSGESMVCRNE